MHDPPFSAGATMSTLSPPSHFTISNCLMSVAAEAVPVMYGRGKYSLIYQTNNSQHFSK